MMHITVGIMQQYGSRDYDYDSEFNRGKGMLSCRVCKHLAISLVKFWDDMCIIR